MSNTDFDINLALEGITPAPASEGFDPERALDGFDEVITQGVMSPTGSPERAAKAIDLSRRSGMPAELIDFDIEAAMEGIERDERAAELEASPELRSFVGSDPMAAKVAADELPHIKFMARFIGFAYGGAKRAERLFEAGVEGAAFAEDAPGPDPDGELATFFRGIGLYNDPARAWNPASAVTEAVIGGGLTLVDFGFRGLQGATYTAGEAAGMLAESFGYDDTGAKREMINFLNFWQIGEAPMFVARPRPGPVTTEIRTRLETQQNNAVLSAESDAAILDRAVDAFENSQIKKRAPNLGAKLVRQNDPKGTVLMVDPQMLQDLYVEQGLFPRPGDPIFGWYPNIGNVIADALENGTDIPIPLAEYLVHVKKEHHKVLIPGIRKEGGLSSAEAQAIVDEIDATLKSAPEVPEIVEATKLGEAGETPVEGFSVGGQFVPDEAQALGLQQRLYEEALAESLGIAKADAPPEVAPLGEMNLATLARTSESAIEQLASEGGPTLVKLAITSEDLRNLRAAGVQISDDGFVTRVEAQRLVAARERFVKLPEEAVAAAKAADADAKAVVKDLYLEPVYRDAKAAGLDAPLFAAYSKNLERLMEGIRVKAIATATRVARRVINAEWRAPYAKALVESQARFDARPEIQLDQALREGTFKMRFADGADRVDPKYLDVGGNTADELADLVGFETGEDLLQALEALRADRGKKKPENYRRQVTEAEATVEANLVVGDQVDRMEMAVGIASSEDVSRVLYDDLRVMQRQTEGELSPPLTYTEMVDKARENFGRQMAGVARMAAPWLRAIKKAGRNVELHLLKGKVDKAFKEQQKQLIAQLNLGEAVRLQQRWVATQRIVKKYVKKNPTNVDAEYADQIRTLMSRFGITVRWKNPEKLETIPDYSTFVTEQNFFNGYDLPNEAFLTTGGVTVETLMVDQFYAFADAVKALDHIARQRQAFKVNNKNVEIRLARAEITQVIESHPPIDTSRRSNWARRFVRSVDASLTKVNRLFDHMADWQPGNVFERYIMEPLYAGEQRRGVLLHEVRKRITAKLPNPQTRVKHNFMNEVAGVKYRFNRGDVAIMALNAGNKRNRQLLVDSLLPSKLEPDSPLATVDAAAREKVVMDFINQTLKAEDWVWIDQVWDLFSWLWPQAEKMYQEINGIIPDRVNAIDTLGHKGGYFPIIRDHIDVGPTPSEKASPFEIDYHKITTPNRYMKARTGNSDKIQLEAAYEQLPRWVQMMVHDIAMRQPVQQVNRLVNNQEVRRAINSRYGVEYSEAITHWVKQIANGLNQSDREMRWIVKKLRATRENLVVAALGANLSVLFSPQLGPFLKELAVNPRDASWIMSHWGQNRDFAMTKSAELRSRHAVAEREAYEASQRILAMSGKWSSFKQGTARFSMLGAFKMDMALATVSWLTDYARAMEKGFDEAGAVALADKRVRDYYGSASPVNRSKIQSSGEFWNQATVFYGYMNTQYNRTATILERSASGYRKVKGGDYAGAKRDFATVASDSFTMVLVPAIFSAALFTDYDEDDSIGEMAFKATAGHATALFPLVRDLYYYMQNNQAPRPTTLFGVGKDLYDTAVAVEKKLSGESESDAWLKKMIMTGGVLLGLPTGQISRSTQFLWNIQTGAESPEGFLEWTRGIMKGYGAPGGMKTGSSGGNSLNQSLGGGGLGEPSL